MFTDRAQAIIDRAKEYASAGGTTELEISAVLAALNDSTEASVLLAEILGLSVEELRAHCPVLPPPVSCSGKLALGQSLHQLLTETKVLADDVPDRQHPGMIDLRHLVCAIAVSHDACALLQVMPCAREDAVNMLALWYDTLQQAPGLQQLTDQLISLRDALLSRVFGQDHAVHAFVEGLFNAELVATADVTRRSPRAVFVFAGPPGVGKTFLAELGASYLGRPFKRFDMSAYSGLQQNEALVGMAKSFHAAHPGVLTEFVEKNPGAILLFDEIEKAHLNTIHLFLQILDAGTLEDKFNEHNVNFRDTTIIFTTNVGRKLYDRPNESGLHRANMSFLRQTILDALEYEKNPTTGEPFFPAAICSRLATGYPVLFNHLRVNELERVVSAEFARMAKLFERQYFKQIATYELLSMCLVLREGARADARTLRSQSETFLKGEIFKFCQLYHAHTDQLEDLLQDVERIRFSLDKTNDLPAEIQALFEPIEKPRVLLIADLSWTALLPELISTVEWYTAHTEEEALQVLAETEIDMVLVDLWSERRNQSAATPADDPLPAAVWTLDRGQELLRKIHERLPDLPVYLLTVRRPGEGQSSLDEELFLACVRGGGARGLLAISEDGRDADDPNLPDLNFSCALQATCRHLYREKMAERLAQARNVLAFDTTPYLDTAAGEVRIELRNLRLARAIASADAGEVLDDVERPRIRFDDVIGAESAKEELRFFIDFLRNPKRFAALGLRPPKGILLHGPPGTGKTMLAKAMAGESNVAFITASASAFVTIWQGSGPQSVRDLFARARRYAPAIIFIDEIDAIGKTRSGTSGSGQGEEMALNALLTEMDGFTGPARDKPVFVLAATNFKIQAEDQDSPERSTRTLDPALVRRFSRCILVDLPDRASRQRYLEMRLQEGKQVDVSPAAIELCAEKSAGMSIANLEQIIEAAAREALRQSTPMTDNLLLDALDTAREGEAKEWSPAFLQSTARHEAGHTIMYWHSGWWAPEVSIIARADHGGGMRPAEEEARRECFALDDLLADIRTSLGGRAAELLYYGKHAGLTTGASGDLERATMRARQIVCRYGMAEEFGLLVTPELFKYAEAISSPIYQQVCELSRTILTEQMEQTLAILSEHRHELDAVSMALLEKNRLYRKDLEAMLPAIAVTQGAL